MVVFDPTTIFDYLYSSSCHRALEAVVQTPGLVSLHTRLIKNRLVDYFVEMQTSGKDAAAIHCTNMKQSNVPWASIFSNQTCLCCIRRRPEPVFLCGHDICDVCVRIHGSPVANSEYTFQLTECCLCDEPGTTKSLKPPTAGARVLSIDGGGIRGVIPLQLLVELQDLIGEDCLIQDLFDLAFGTSSGSHPLTSCTQTMLTVLEGGLIVLGLFARQWGVRHCASVFDALARDLFRRRFKKSGGFWQRIKTIMRCWLSDGYYNAAHLESAMQKHLSLDQKLFSAASARWAKIAVTATSIGDNALAIILPNYNGSTQRQGNCG